MNDSRLLFKIVISNSNYRLLQHIIEAVLATASCSVSTESLVYRKGCWFKCIKEIVFIVGYNFTEDSYVSVASKRKFSYL